MTWRVIASKDYYETKDSRLIRYLVYLVVLVILLGGYVFPAVTTGAVTTSRFAGFMTTTIGLLLPLVGLLLGYNAIVGERESGQLALLLSLPYERRDVVAGKLVGRGVHLVLAVLVGFIGAGVLVWYPFGSVSHAAYAAYILLTLLFGIIFFGIGLALSTLTVSKQRANVGAFGIFFLFVVVWDLVAELLRFGLEQIGLADGTLPDWALFVHGAEPGMLYERLVAAFFENSTAGPYLGPEAPWYLGEWMALVLFVLWIVLPIAAGYRRFERTDL